MTKNFQEGLAEIVYNEQHRKIAAAAMSQLESIKLIVGERGHLKKKLKYSKNELEYLERDFAMVNVCASRKPGTKLAPSKPTTHIPFVSSLAIAEPNSCEEDIKTLERGIEEMRKVKLTADLEMKTNRKEVNALKKYCAKLSSIQEENCQLKVELSKYEEAMNLLGFKPSGVLHFEDLKEKLEKLNEIVHERDDLKNRVVNLEKELNAYTDLPEDIEKFKQRSLMLDEVLQDRDRLKKKVEQLKDIDEELHTSRKYMSRIDELEEKLKKVKKEKKAAEAELGIMKSKCSSAEIEANNQKTECNMLRSQLTCKEREVEILKSACNQTDDLKAERDTLHQNIDEIMRMRVEYDQMCLQLKCLDHIKSERNMYKIKYESMLGIECECEILRAQVERARRIEKERDILLKQIDDFECCIAEQEDEIIKLVCHIDDLVQGRIEKEAASVEAGQDNQIAGPSTKKRFRAD